MVTEMLSDAEARMKKAIDALQRGLATLRTGRSQPSLVENIMVDYYGVPTPLHQMASITAPEAQLILVQPWDRQALSSIEKGILKSGLGLNPSSDGTVIRVPIPTLTEERRRELVRLVKQKVEQGRVVVRNIRRDELERVRAMEKSKEISQDELHRAQDRLQKLTDTYVGQVDRIGQDKEAEVMEV